MKKRPLVIGLTGSIGMGKSTVAKMFGRLGLRILSADAVVHDLLKKDGAAVSRVAKLFPESQKEGQIDRKVLRQAIIEKPEKLRALEAILHPLVWKAERAFIRQAKKDGVKGVVLEIPLLFETKSEARMDVVVCVHAPKGIQKKRVLARRGMTKERFDLLLSQQIPAREKKARANYIISTGIPLDQTRARVKKVWEKIKEIAPDA